MHSAIFRSPIFPRHDHATLLPSDVCIRYADHTAYSHPSKDFHLNCRFYLHAKRNTRSETVRAEDRAVTESVARSRALHFYPTPSGSRSLSHTHPRSGPLSSRRTFSISLSRIHGLRKNVPRSFPLSAISFPCKFNPSRFPLLLPLLPPSLFLLFFSFSLASSLFYRPCLTHTSFVPFHLAK